MRTQWRVRGFVRALVVVLVVVLAAGLVPAAVATGVAAAESSPSVDLPEITSVNVAAEGGRSRGQDQASQRALNTSQTSAPPRTGTPTATPLAPSANWEVSGNSGDFSWSYPLRVPPAPGGLAPELELTYSSSSVDGRSGVTNNQPSWIGEGWDLWPGFVERTYGSCLDDGQPATKRTADLCWRSDNATAGYPGGGGMLICCDSAGRWRTKTDDGSRVERLLGAANGDQGSAGTTGDQGEHWRITTVDGTQYWFGSQVDSGSTWTVPVFGDDTGEPRCGGREYCTQAWRWNLDKVVDRNGNVIRYFYSPEKNRYGLDMANTGVEYDRGGTLVRVDYGLHEGVNAPASAQVVFESADRCIPGLPAGSCGHDKPGNWPDTPLDLACGASCTHHAPSFWTTKRLTTITTTVREGGAYVPVDRWTLGQLYPEPVDPTGQRKENAALWLKEIRRTGLAGATPVHLPPVTFEGTQLANRVDSDTDGRSGIWRYRITGIISESGGVTSVDYAEPDCGPGRTPASPQTNTMRCYPVRWERPGGGLETDWFHKYVVSAVVEADVVSTGVEKVTRYEYLDGAAWHWDVSEFVKEERRTWNEFRGFGRVRISTGSADDPGDSPITMTERRFYRGMNGDRGRPEEVTVRDSLRDGQSSRLDSDWLSGFEFESTTYEKAAQPGQVADPPVVSRTVSYPHADGPTASRGEYHAYLVRRGTERRLTALSSGGFGEVRTTTRYGNPAARGLPTQVEDLGDTATDADDLCTNTTYAPDTDAWLLDLVAKEETVSVGCGSTPTFPEDAVSASRYTHDDNGNVTVTEVAKQRPAAEPTYHVTATARYDRHGRVTSATDAMGKESRVAYTPAEGGPVTGLTATTPITATLPRGLTTTTTLDPAFGTATKVVDPNERVTEVDLDSLGRTVQVWLPNRPRGEAAQGSLLYSYLVRRDGPSVVTTRSVGPNGVHTTTNTLYDGLLRPRQVQRAAVGMKEEPNRPAVPVDEGRLLVDTHYDSHGRAYKTTRPYFNAGAVDTTLWGAPDTSIPSLTRTRFDGAGRPVEEVQQAGAHDIWRTTWRYGGDRVHTTPPAGGTATTVISDAAGRTTELRQYHGPTPEGGHDTTRYEYTPSSQLAKVTGPDGAVWRYHYDLRGRKIGSVDPDAGAATMGYDDAGRLTSTTDALGRTTVQVYDELGRRTELRADGTTGTLLSRWTYDTAVNGKGLPATATRWHDGVAYGSRVDGYTALDKPLSTTVTIPAEEGLLEGSYTWGYGYGADGSVTSERYPAVPRAGVVAQTVNHDQDHWGRPTATRTTSTRFVTGTHYTRYGEVERLEHGVTPKRGWQSFLYDTNTRRLVRSVVDAEVPEPMLADVRYTYDDAGTITSMADLTVGKPADVQCFRHDHLRRLNEAWTASAAEWSKEDGCTAEPTVAPGPAPYWHTFRHGPGGNRLEEIRRTQSATATRTYGYPTEAQPHTLRTVTGPGGTETYGYNAVGQTTTRSTPGSHQELTWDREGHLMTVTGTGGTTSFGYDSEGERLLRKDPTGTTLYLGKQEVHLAASGGAPKVTRYYTHGDRVVAMQQGDELSWLAGDHQGTSQIAINTATLAVTQRRQLPYGGSRGPAVTWPGERGFVGGTIDPGIDLTHLGAREYDPNTGRFISLDPVMDKSDPQQLHGYAYANNNPVTFSDPTGLYCAGPDGIGCRHKASKEGYGDMRDPANRSRYEQDYERWTNYTKSARNKAESTLRNGDGVRCADGDRYCKPVHGAAEAQARYLELLKKDATRRELEARLPNEVKSLINIDELLKFDSVGICYEVAGHVIVGGSLQGCVNFDEVGMSLSFAVEFGVELSIGSHTAIVIRGAMGEKADNIDHDVSHVRSAAPAKNKGTGFQVVWEESLTSDNEATIYEARFGPGFHPSLGAGQAIQGGVNSGYIVRWDQLKLGLNRLTR